MLYQRAYYKVQSIVRNYLPLAELEEKASNNAVCMEYRSLGRTGIRVSVMALGCGGPSRLGLKKGKSVKEAKRLVCQAFDMGINCVDTAHDYGTNALVGLAIQPLPRESIVLSCKVRLRNILKMQLSPPTLKSKVEAALRDFNTDYIDIYQVASVLPQDYPYVREVLVPCLLKLKQEGKIRALGITEAFYADTHHDMLTLALEDDCWDVMMVGFNLLNQSARKVVFPKTQAKNIGVMAMYAVRRALRSEQELEKMFQLLHKSGQISPDVTVSSVRKHLIGPDKALTIQDLAYRFCRCEPGVDVVLCGTGRLSHLQENVQSILKPPLSTLDLELARDWFGQVSEISGN